MKTRQNNYPQTTLAKVAAATFTLTLLLLLTSCTTGPKWIKGQWEGTGYQIDGKAWEVTVNAKKLKAIQVDYPGLECGGEWQLLETTETQAKGKELLKYGLDHCDKDVEIALTPAEGNKLKVEFYLLWYSPDPIAAAVLERK